MVQMNKIRFTCHSCRTPALVRLICLPQDHVEFYRYRVFSLTSNFEPATSQQCTHLLIVINQDHWSTLINMARFLITPWFQTDNARLLIRPEDLIVHRYQGAWFTQRYRWLPKLIINADRTMCLCWSDNPLELHRGSAGPRVIRRTWKLITVLHIYICLPRVRFSELWYTVF